MHPTLLAALAEDATADAARAFAELAARQFAEAGEGAVSSGRTPAELAARFAEPLPVGRRPLAAILDRLTTDVAADANHLLHPMSLGHQVSAPLPAAVWTETLIAALNQSLAVSEMSPTLTAVERQVVRWMADLAGFGPEAGGTFTSGGTEATFAALLAARAAALPAAWRDGVGADPPVVVCGEHAHYAVARAVGELGIGLRNVVVVPSDARHRMDAEALASTLDAIERDGRRVMAVVATAGCTATGAYDDLAAIGLECTRRGLWLHVDGAHGASALLSPAARHRLAGLEHVRSLAWDPHKLLLMPLSAGVVLVRDRRDLAAAFAQRAPYLFHGDGDESPDLGRLSFQCSRRGDALKLWVALQRYGADGLGELHDHLCGLARALHAAIGRRADFEALHAPQSNILCFRWVGAPEDAVRALPPAALDALTDRVRARYNAGGEGWITVTTLDGRRVLRVTVMNPRTTPEHLLALLDGLARTGRAAAAELSPESAAVA